MNATINKLLMAGDKFMSEMQLIQPVVTCSAYGSFTKIQRHNTKIQRNRRLEVHLSERPKQALFPTQYGLWCVQRST